MPRVPLPRTRKQAFISLFAATTLATAEALATVAYARLAREPAPALELGTTLPDDLPFTERWREVEALGAQFHENGTPAGMIGYDGDTVLPTVVSTDAAGRIFCADQTDNYRVRPTPATVLAALSEAGLAPTAEVALA